MRDTNLDATVAPVAATTNSAAAFGLLAAESTKLVQDRIFHLVTLDLGPDQAEEDRYLHIVDANYVVHYTDIYTDAQVAYSPFPFQFSQTSMNSDGSIDKASISIANIKDLASGIAIMDTIKAHNGLRNCRIKVKTVYEKFLDFIYTTDAAGNVTTTVNNAVASAVRKHSFVEEEFIIDSYSATEQMVQFQLEPVVDFTIKLPRRLFTASSCYWQTFGDADTCGYEADTSGMVATATPYGNLSNFAVNSTVSNISLKQGDLISFSSAPEVVYTVLSINEPSFYAGRSIQHGYLDKPATYSLQAIFFRTCGKSLRDCQRRGNTARFGGFPGVRSSRRIYI